MIRFRASRWRRRHDRLMADLEAVTLCVNDLAGQPIIVADLETLRLQAKYCAYGDYAVYERVGDVIVKLDYNERKARRANA